jgi:hypothetical protein
MSTIFPIYNIFYISTFYNMPPQAEGGGSTRSLKRKAVNEEVGRGLVKTSHGVQKTVVLAAEVAAAAEKKKTTEKERQPWNGKSSCAEIHG